MTSTPGARITMSNTTKRMSLADIAAKISGAQARAAAAQAEAVELEREQRWAEGEARRERLGKLRMEAETVVTAQNGTGAELRRLALELAQAVARVHAAAHEHNGRIQDLRARLTEENVPPLGATPWPSPAHGGVAPTSGGIAVGLHRVQTVEPRGVVDQAVQAAERGAELEPDTFADVAQLGSEVPDYPSGTRFYRHAEHGGVFTFDKEPEYANGLIPIGRREFLCRTWGVDLDALPADVFPPSPDDAS